MNTQHYKGNLSRFAGVREAAADREPAGEILSPGLWAKDREGARTAAENLTTDKH